MIFSSISGGSVSCIAVDAQSGVVAVAGDKCQLLVYTQWQGELQSWYVVQYIRVIEQGMYVEGLPPKFIYVRLFRENTT